MASTATLRPRCTFNKPATNNSDRRTTARMRTAASVASMWRQVQGSDDWAGLLEPLHPVVRDEVARYGDLVDACYAALDTDPSSRRYMCCKHGKERVLQQAAGGGADAGGRGYEVTRYIYATPDVTRGPSSSSVASNSSSWVGYVAVSTDETTRRLGRRDVLVAFRGTVSRAEWTANLMSSLKPARLGDTRSDDVRVESGFLNLYTSSSSAGNDGMGSCREQLLREVSRLIASFSNSNPAAGAGGDTDDMSVTLVGHSMGSALAMLLAYDLAERGLTQPRVAPVTVFSFGGPRVGNAAFKARCDELGVKALRVANVLDPVTKLPGLFLNEGTPRGLRGDCYVHVGVELALDLLRLRDLGSVHHLATYVASLRAYIDHQPRRAGAAQ